MLRKIAQNPDIIFLQSIFFLLIQPLTTNKLGEIFSTGSWNGMCYNLLIDTEFRNTHIKATSARICVSNEGLVALFCRSQISNMLKISWQENVFETMKIVAECPLERTPTKKKNNKKTPSLHAQNILSHWLKMSLTFIIR